MIGDRWKAYAKSVLWLDAQLARWVTDPPVHRLDGEILPRFRLPPKDCAMIMSLSCEEADHFAQNDSAKQFLRSIRGALREEVESPTLLMLEALLVEQGVPYETMTVEEFQDLPQLLAMTRSDR